MNYKSMTHTLAGGLAVLAALSLAPSAHAAVASPYTFVASLPLTFTPSVAVGSADALLFTFGSATGGANYQAAKFVGSNFVFDSSYQVDVVTSVLSGQTTGHYGYTLDSNSQISTVSLYNNGAANTLSFSPPYTSSTSGDTKTGTPTASSLFLAFSSVGGPATFNLAFYDDPTIAPFTLSEVYTDPASKKTVTKSLLAGSFSPSGFTPNAPGPTAVPEASDMALLGLGALPLLGLVRARRRAARA